MLSADFLAELEGLAAAFHEEARIGAPVDPWALAWALELEVFEGPRGLGTYLCGDAIFVDPADRIERQGFRVSHECAHAMLRTAGLPNTERTADALAGRLLMPRLDFVRHLRRAGGCLYALREMNPWASHEAITRRIASVSPTVAIVWDRVAPRRRRYRITSPGIAWHRREPLEVEMDAMLGALDDGGPVESVSGVRAWGIREPGFERAICVSSFESLTAYL